MKLQNDQTGQVENFCIDKDQICSCDRAFVYDSLAQLQEAGWKDYEEPKETALEEMIRKLESDFEKYPDEWDNLEEAEKAVEKLKACLAQMQEAGWKDYEEPKETALEEMIRKLESDFEKYPDEWDNLEEAEKAVEKLKAWKRLEDKGFKWRYYAMGDGGKFRAYFSIKDGVDIGADLDLLFGGEE